MSRAVPEWVGATDDAAIPRLVRLRIWDRCGGKCALTGRKILVGEPYDFDHIIPLALGGRHAESNLQVVAREAHREKTADDTAMIRKAQRIHAKHHGYFPKSKHRLQGRGFGPSRELPRPFPKAKP